MEQAMNILGMGNDLTSMMSLMHHREENLVLPPIGSSNRQLFALAKDCVYLASKDTSLSVSEARELRKLLTALTLQSRHIDRLVKLASDMAAINRKIKVVGKEFISTNVNVQNSDS